MSTSNSIEARSRARRAHFATTRVQPSTFETAMENPILAGHKAAARPVGLLVCKCDFASPSMPDIARSSLESCISGSGHPSISMAQIELKGANERQRTMLNRLAGHVQHGGIHWRWYINTLHHRSSQAKAILVRLPISKDEIHKVQGICD